MRALLLATTLAIGLAEPALAAAADTTPEFLSPLLQPVIEVDWSQLLTKTFVYQSLSTVLEAGLFVLFYGAGTGALGTMAMATAASAGTVYFVHEYIWESALPDELDRGDPTLVLAKTLAYRAVSTLRSVTWGGTLAAVSAVTAGWTVAFVALDSGLYALTDLAFARWRPPAEMPPLTPREIW